MTVSSDRKSMAPADSPKGIGIWDMYRTWYMPQGIAPGSLLRNMQGSDGLSELPHLLLSSPHQIFQPVPENEV
jgi:hypothetical protein